MESVQVRSAVLQLIDSQNQLTISSATFPSSSIGQLITMYYAGNALVLQNVSVLPSDPGSPHTVVSGTASFLNVENAVVSATFLEKEDEIDLILKYQLPTTWRFSQSFPALPQSWDFRTPLDSPQQSYLDLLTLSDSCFVVSTVEHIDEQFQVQIEPGLSFASHLQINGILGTLESLLTVSQPLVLSGLIVMPSQTQPVVQPLLPSQLPLKNSPPRPGINLKAEGASNLAFGPLDLKDVYVRLYSPLTEDWLNNNPTYEPGLFFGGNLQVGEDLSLEIIAEKVLGNDHSLVFTGVFDGLVLPSLSHLADLLGGDDLREILVPDNSAPAFFSEAGALSIESVLLSVTTQPFSIESAYLTIGLKDMTWQALDGFFEVDCQAVRFQVESPFNDQRSLEAMLFGTMSIDDVPVNITASAPEFTVQAELADAETIPLANLMRTYIPDVPPMSDLTVNQVYFEMEPGNSFNLLAAIANQPQPWVIDIGKTPLTVEDIELLLSYVKGSGISGTIGGVLNFAGITLNSTCQIPGPLVLTGQLPPISLKTLITSLCEGVVIWPGTFDITLSNAGVQLKKQASDYLLLLGTQVDQLGSLALQVSRENGTWSFAVGVDIQEQWKLSNISAVLAPFDNSFTFNKFLLLLSTIESPTFSFPDLSAFNDPTITSPGIVLPGKATGIVKGCTVYAEMTFGGNKGLELIKNMFVLNQATLDIMLQVGENPANSMLIASMGGQINSALSFSGALRLKLSTDEVSIGLLGNLSVTVQNHPLVFAGEMDITENGALFAASMQGSWVDAFTIKGLTISDVALVLGIDWELVPTVGLAGTLDIQGKEGSVAIVLDSVTPSKSLLAGSISDLTVGEVYQAFVGRLIPNPAELASVLDRLILKGIPLFTIPTSLAGDLDKAVVTPAISQAFQQSGKITLGSSLLLVASKPGSTWHLTDRSNLNHYTIQVQGDHLQVSLEVQLAVVPDITMIGAQIYQPGIRLVADLNCLGFDASARVSIDRRSGLLLDGSMSSINLGEIFSLTGHNGQGGPRISLATYDVPQSPYRGPHCVMSGALTMLDFTRDIDLAATRDGVRFSVAAKIFNVFQASISAQCPLDHFATAQFLIAATMENDLFDYLKTHGTVAIVQAASAAQTAITQAQAKVDAAQAQVNTLNSQIATQMSIIQAERSRAQQALQNAQTNVDNIQNTINANQSAINSLQNEINDLEADVRAHPLHAFSNGAKITEKEGEIGAHKAAILSEQTALATATATLNASKAAVATTPVNADPRVSHLYVELETATVSLTAANAFLDSVKKASGDLANTAAWMTQHGSDHLLVINHASFTGQLSEVSGGVVNMALDLTLTGQAYSFNLSFNFHDLDTTLKKFVDQLKQRIQ